MGPTPSPAKSRPQYLMNATIERNLRFSRWTDSSIIQAARNGRLIVGGECRVIDATSEFR